jgi:hypothetical protein
MHTPDHTIRSGDHGEASDRCRATVLALHVGLGVWRGDPYDSPCVFVPDGLRCSMVAVLMSFHLLARVLGMDPFTGLWEGRSLPMHVPPCPSMGRRVIGCVGASVRWWTPPCRDIHHRTRPFATLLRFPPLMQQGRSLSGTVATVPHTLRLVASDMCGAFGIGNTAPRFGTCVPRTVIPMTGPRARSVPTGRW